MEFFTADHHFGHWSSEDRSIIKYCNRPFETIDEMDLSITWATLRSGILTLRGDTSSASMAAYTYSGTGGITTDDGCPRRSVSQGT